MGLDRNQKVHGDFAGGSRITTDEISDSRLIVMGRGKKAPVQQTSVVKGGRLIKPPKLIFGELIAQIDESDLPPDLKGRMHSVLDDLRSEVERGEAGDVKNTKMMLQEISGTMPDLNRPLMNWLEGTEHVSMPIKIVARKVLAY